MKQLPALKVRLDKLLLQRGLAASRERAQALVLAGRVLVNEQKVEKAGASVADDVTVRLLGEEMRYVSRGGLKLEHALAHWHIDLTARTCLDIGASTGGFVDCMLQHGASCVIAVDTGRGQIAAKLRPESDFRIRLLENYNARYLKPQDLPKDLPEAVSFLSMDVSFISATLVLPAVIAAISSTLREAIVLVKPQFEVGRQAIGKGGIVRDEQAQSGAVARVQQCITQLGAAATDVVDSPILGREGNREFLLYAQFND